MFIYCYKYIFEHLLPQIYSYCSVWWSKHYTEDCISPSLVPVLFSVGQGDIYYHNLLQKYFSTIDTIQSTRRNDTQNYWVFGLFLLSGILLETRIHDVSKTGSFSILRWGEKRIQFPKRRVFYFLVYRTMEKVQKPSNSECYTPSSVPFRIIEKWDRNDEYDIMVKEVVVWLHIVMIKVPITVAARTKAWTVFARSNSGIVSSNPTRDIDVYIVCIYSVFCVVLCVGRGIATGWSPFQGELPTV
jgi:hypothetical protein